LAGDRGKAGSSQVSLQLRSLALAMRVLLRPIFTLALKPAMARRGFRLASTLFIRPRGLLVKTDAILPDMLWISVGKADPARVILYFHGGAYIACDPMGYRGLVGRISQLTGLKVAAPTYRLAPEHPAPAAFEDAQRAHEAVVAAGYDPGQIILGGDSAGGGLALALLADLCARGLQPAGLFAFSPWTDLSMTGASLVVNAAADPVLPAARMPDIVKMVVGDLDPKDARISPLFADFVRPSPTLIQVGTTEILRDDARRMVQRLQLAGGQATLSEWQAAPHVWQLLDGYVPEARAALTEVASFISGLESAAASSL
jgi:epsilon-lactone hydrolase